MRCFNLSMRNLAKHVVIKEAMHDLSETPFYRTSFDIAATSPEGDAPSVVVQDIRSWI